MYKKPPSQIDYVDYPWLLAFQRYLILPAGQVKLIDYLGKYLIYFGEYQARNAQAPPTSLCHTKRGYWFKLEDITDQKLRQWMIDYANSIGLIIPQYVWRAWEDPNYKPFDPFAAEDAADVADDEQSDREFLARMKAQEEARQREERQSRDDLSTNYLDERSA